MTEESFVDKRLTERRNPATVDIDVASPGEIVEMMHHEDKSVADGVYSRHGEIATAIELAENALRAEGRIVYVGAGTSGRLGVLDAAECPPTFGAEPWQVVGVIAGGFPALVRSQEGSEDDVNAGISAMNEREIGTVDFVIGIAASGTTPYVRAALGRAQALGAKTGLITCTDPPKVLADTCDVVIDVRVGAEVLTGSTRLKAGTATKMVLNMISTGAMIRLGKAYGNLMVDLMANSEKLIDRGERIVMEVCGVSRNKARIAIDEAGGSVKLALVMASKNVGATTARELLNEAGGVVRKVIGEPPPTSASEA